MTDIIISPWDGSDSTFELHKTFSILNQRTYRQEYDFKNQKFWF